MGGPDDGCEMLVGGVKSPRPQLMSAKSTLFSGKLYDEFVRVIDIEHKIDHSLMGFMGRANIPFPWIKYFRK